jgi:[acyl-carrier-protein] S-malonyltransferase
MIEKVAFAFPGVGVRHCGHEQAFFARHCPAMEAMLETASRFAGADLVAAITGGNGVELPERESQLFTYAFNCAVANVYVLHGVRPDLLAGHSMGIYSALATAGVIEFEEGLAIVERAYQVVTAACPGGVGGMAVVVGLTRPEIEELLSGPGRSSVRVVNSNNDTTKILAGRRSELEAFVAAATDAQALKARLLPVGSPYHHPELLDGAPLELERFLRGFEWRAARCPIVSSIDQRLLVTGEDLLRMTALNIATPIDWERVMLTLTELGVRTVLECGAGVSLSQNGRMMPSPPEYVTVKNSERRVGL